MPVAASKAKALFTIGKLNLTPLLRYCKPKKVNLTPLVLFTIGKLNLTPLLKLNTPWKTFSLHRPLNRLTQDISS